MPSNPLYGTFATANGQVIQAPPQGDTHQTVTISGTSAQSSAFQDDTKLIRISSDAECWYLIGANPTATNVKSHLPAAHVEYRSVEPGNKIAAIGTSGTLYIEEIQ